MTDEATSPAPQSTLPVPRRSWIKTIAFGVILLLSGMVIGSGLTVIGIRRWANEMRDRPDMFSERILARMQNDLKLTNQQKTEIEKIFKDAREELDEVRQRHRAQGQAYFKEIHDKVAQVLTSTQQKNWDDWWRRARERAFKDRPGGPSRSGKEPGGSDRDHRPKADADRGAPRDPSDRTIPPAFQREVAPGPPPNGIPELHFAPDPSASGPETQPEVRRVPSPQSP
jgi:hypothetical protein